MRMAAAIERTAAVTATGVRQERATARSPSSEDMTRHSRSRGALIVSLDIADISRAALAIATCRAWHLRHEAV